MAISKINFTGETPLLNKMLNNTVTQPAPAEVSPPEKKSNVKKNLTVGLSSATILISLGVLGYKGYLGKGIQKLTGGIKKHSSDIAEETQTKLEEIIPDKKPKIEPEIKTPSLSAKQAQINAMLDRTIPEISEPLSLEEAPFLPECYDEILKAARKESLNTSTKLHLINVDDKIYNVTVNKNGKIISIISSDDLILYDDYENLIYHEKRFTNLGAYYKDGKITNIKKTTRNSLYNYNSRLKLNNINQRYGENGAFEKISVITPEGYVGLISHADTKTGKEIKRDWFNSEGKLIREEFFSDSGDITDTINY